MYDTGGYLLNKMLYESRVAERQRELAAAPYRRQARKQRWDSVRLTAARGLRRLAVAIEPTRQLRVPAQRQAA